jgi:hypothetical protein
MAPIRKVGPCVLGPGLVNEDQAFYGLLALFPAITAFVSLYGPVGESFYDRSTFLPCKRSASRWRDWKTAYFVQRKVRSKA